MERNQEMPGLQSLHQVRYILVCYFHQVHTGILNFPNSKFVPPLAMHLQLIFAYDQVLLALPEVHCQFLHHHWCYFLWQQLCFLQCLKYYLYSVVHVSVLHHLNQDHESVFMFITANWLLFWCTRSSCTSVVSSLFIILLYQPSFGMISA